MVTNSSAMPGGPFCSPLNEGYLWPRLTACEILVSIAAREGDAVQETQPHFPLKNMPLSRKHQQLSYREQPHTSPFLLALLGSPNCCLAETHAWKTPREDIGMATCFMSHLAALGTNTKQPVILTCCCTVHTARSVIHFLWLSWQAISVELTAVVSQKSALTPQDTSMLGTSQQRVQTIPSSRY